MQQDMAARSWGLWRGEDLTAAAAAAELLGYNHLGSCGGLQAVASGGGGSFPSLIAAASAASSFYPLEMGAGIVDEPLDRALAASRNHREAEKRRRERIKSHLDCLRHLLACDPKIDKASLLAKAVEHVRDLKQRAEQITEIEHFPTETDEITVDPAGDLHTINGRRSIIKASLCCEDRPRLLPELIETLKSLRLRTLRAEIATLGGRLRSVLVVTREEEEDDDDDEAADDGGDGGSAVFLRDALKALVERQVGGGERTKRRRVLDREIVA